MNPNFTYTITDSFNRGLITAAAFIPNLISGAIMLLIGIVAASIAKKIIISLFKTVRLDAYFKKYGISDTSGDFSWTNILSEIIRWFIFVLFLIPTTEIWGLPQVAKILNTFLMYIPNVFVAAIIGLIGLVFARLMSDVVLGSTKELDPQVSRTVASSTRIAITIFILLAVLNQLGVAQDLIKIFFTGVVAMLSIAGGIAFGLGGKEYARDILSHLVKKVK